MNISNFFEMFIVYTKGLEIETISNPFAIITVYILEDLRHNYEMKEIYGKRKGTSVSLLHPNSLAKYDVETSFVYSSSACIVNHWTRGTNRRS